MTLGLSQYIHEPVDVTCQAVEFLYKNGAIPFCFTNVPQTMYSLQCSNPAFGATGNAHDPARECGGSSGEQKKIVFFLKNS